MFIEPGRDMTTKAPLGAKCYAAPKGDRELFDSWAINITRLTALYPMQSGDSSSGTRVNGSVFLRVFVPLW